MMIPSSLFVFLMIPSFLNRNFGQAVLSDTKMRNFPPIKWDENEFFCFDEFFSYTPITGIAKSAVQK